MGEFGREDFLEMAVTQKSQDKDVKCKVETVLNETRLRWPAGRSEYFLQTEADISAFRCFSMAVLRSASSMEEGMECLKLIRGPEHIRKLIGTFLLLGGIEFWDRIKECTISKFKVGKSPLDTLTVAPDPNQFEYALRQACFNTLEKMEKMEKKGRTYRGCLSEYLLKELIERRGRNFTLIIESRSEKRKKDDYCAFLKELIDSENGWDDFWGDVNAAYKKRVGNSQ